jgi:hypothetical protein
MQELARPKNIPIPVSSLDPEGLRQLAGVYNSVVEDEVHVIAGDVLPEIIDRSHKLASKIEGTVGVTAMSETTILGLLTLDESDKDILKRARYLQPKRVI